MCPWLLLYTVECACSDKDTDYRGKQFQVPALCPILTWPFADMFILSNSVFQFVFQLVSQ